MDIPIVEQKVKDAEGNEKTVKVFVGVEDSNNPPIIPKVPNKRYCRHCGRESDNDKVNCDHCGRTFDDGKMECPICHKFFEYLVGEDDNFGGKQGCESCWKPPIHEQ